MDSSGEEISCPDEIRQDIRINDDKSTIPMCLRELKSDYILVFDLLGKGSGKVSKLYQRCKKLRLMCTKLSMLRDILEGAYGPLREENNSDKLRKVIIVTKTNDSDFQKSSDALKSHPNAFVLPEAVLETIVNECTSVSLEESRILCNKLSIPKDYSDKIYELINDCLPEGISESDASSYSLPVVTHCSFVIQDHLHQYAPQNMEDFEVALRTEQTLIPRLKLDETTVKKKRKLIKSKSRSCTKRGHSHTYKMVYKITPYYGRSDSIVCDDFSCPWWFVNDNFVPTAKRLNMTQVPRLLIRCNFVNNIYFKINKGFMKAKFLSAFYSNHPYAVENGNSIVMTCNDLLEKLRLRMYSMEIAKRLFLNILHRQLISSVRRQDDITTRRYTSASQLKKIVKEIETDATIDMIDVDGPNWQFNVLLHPEMLVDYRKRRTPQEQTVWATPETTHTSMFDRFMMFTDIVTMILIVNYDKMAATLGKYDIKVPPIISVVEERGERMMGFGELPQPIDNKDENVSGYCGICGADFSGYNDHIASVGHINKYSLAMANVRFPEFNCKEDVVYKIFWMIFRNTIHPEFTPQGIQKEINLRVISREKELYEHFLTYFRRIPGFSDVSNTEIQMNHQAYKPCDIGLIASENFQKWSENFWSREIRLLNSDLVNGRSKFDPEARGEVIGKDISRILFAKELYFDGKGHNCAGEDYRRMFLRDHYRVLPPPSSVEEIKPNCLARNLSTAFSCCNIAFKKNLSYSNSQVHGSKSGSRSNSAAAIAQMRNELFCHYKTTSFDDIEVVRSSANDVVPPKRPRSNSVSSSKSCVLVDKDCVSSGLAIEHSKDIDVASRHRLRIDNFLSKGNRDLVYASCALLPFYGSQNNISCCRLSEGAAAAELLYYTVVSNPKAGESELFTKEFSQPSDVGLLSSLVSHFIDLY